MDFDVRHALQHDNLAAPAPHIPHPAPTPAPAPAAHEAARPGHFPSMWDGATNVADHVYRGLTGWNFEGRDHRNGQVPSETEIRSDPAWRLMGPKETIYHDNNRGEHERKYVRNDPHSLFGMGGKEAVFDGDTGRPMEAGAYQATYNYVNPAKGGMGDLSPEGVARNLGHMALDVVPYWFGGTVRGAEGTNFAQRMLGPETYNKAGQAWEGARSNTAHYLSGVGGNIAAGWHGLTDWTGARHRNPDPQQQE